MDEIHGQWIKKVFVVPLSDSTMEKFQCSVCKLLFDAETKFCPECGTKMDRKMYLRDLSEKQKKQMQKFGHNMNDFYNGKWVDAELVCSELELSFEEAFYSYDFCRILQRCSLLGLEGNGHVIKAYFKLKED